MKLKVEKREVLGKKVKNLRASNMIPASVYGPGIDPMNIQVDGPNFRKAFEKVGFNTFFDLEIEEGKPFKVLVKDVQIHPVKDSFISISFYQISENKKITVEVPVIVEGVAPAVQLNLGFLVQQMDTISVHCLPKDLPHEFKVDISTLEKEGDAITVGQIQLPENVELSSDMDATSAIVYIGTAQKEEEEAPAEGEEGAEVVDGETPAEGSEAPKAEEGENKAE